MSTNIEGNPERVVLLVDEFNDSVVDPVLDAVRVTNVGASPPASSVITDIEDGAGDSVMDPVNDAVRVNVVAGTISLNSAEPEPPARVALANTAEQTLVGAPGAGLSIYVTDMTGSNDGGQRTRVDLKEGTGGTIRYSYTMAQNGGGFAHSLRSAWKLPANTALRVQQTASVAAFVTVNYFIDA